MKKIILLITILLISTANLTSAQDFNEADLFADDDSMIVEQSTIEDDSINQEKESVTFTGEIETKGIYHMDRDWLSGKDGWNKNYLINYSSADFFLDVRLKKGVKAFIDLSLASGAQSVTTASIHDVDDILKEFFVDANLNKQIYFRVGKQVLKWGRTYMWNPTDMINVEKKSFFDMDATRTGVYGSKVHMPFGSEKNLYFFTTFSEADNLDYIAVAAKYEFLIENSEMALSMWKKKGFGPTYGYDFSTNFLGLDITGETSCTYIRSLNKVEPVGNTANIIADTKLWQNMASLGISKSFDWEKSDRINLTGELFYNSTGYKKNIFKNTSAVELLNNNSLYTANYHAMYYGALFCSINKYPYPDMITSINLISNLSDGSYILMSGISYEPINHFTIGSDIIFFAGEPKGEYTYLGTGIGISAYSKIVF